MATILKKFRTDGAACVQQLRDLGNAIAAHYDASKAPEDLKETYRHVWMCIMHTLPDTMHRLHTLTEATSDLPGQLQHFIFTRDDTIKEIEAMLKIEALEDPQLGKALAAVKQAQSIAATALNALGGPNPVWQVKMEVDRITRFGPLQDKTSLMLVEHDEVFGHEAFRPFYRWCTATTNFYNMSDDTPTIPQWHIFMLQQKDALRELIDAHPAPEAVKKEAFADWLDVMTRAIDRLAQGPERTPRNCHDMFTL